MNENILCDKIAALRRASAMTQEQLAARLVVTYQAVSKWENAQSCPDIMLLPSLAEVFQVSIDQLFGRETAPAPAEEAPPEPEARVIYGALPWTNDGSLHAVLYRGHTLLENKPLSPPEAALCEKVELHVEGDVEGDVSSAYSVSVSGEVGGDVDAGGSVSCTGGIGGDVRAGRDVRCGVEPEEDEDGEKPFRVSGFGKGNHVVIETESDGLDPELSQMIGELTGSAKDTARKASQTAKDISAMVSKYFEDRFK